MKFKRILLSRVLPLQCSQAETEQLRRQIEELSSRIGELMAEKDTIQNRNSLLEKVVQVRTASDKSAQSQVAPASSLACPLYSLCA